MSPNIVELRDTTRPQLKLKGWLSQPPTVRLKFRPIQGPRQWRRRLARFDDWCLNLHDETLLWLICGLLAAGVSAPRLGRIIDYFERINKTVNR